MTDYQRWECISYNYACSVMNYVLSDYNINYTLFIKHLEYGEHLYDLRSMNEM